MSEESVHHLKTWPGYYQAVAEGRKTFEIRKDDRGYCNGDLLILHEWEPKTRVYTGRVLLRRVTYIVGLGTLDPAMSAYVAMSVAPVDPSSDGRSEERDPSDASSQSPPVKSDRSPL